MKSGLMVSWAERCFSLAAARLLVLLLILGAAGSAQATAFLKIETAGSGAGTVLSVSSTATTPPADGINCSTINAAVPTTNCSEDITLPVGTAVVTLKATPDPGSTFVSWGGACTGTGLCVVTNNGLTADVLVTATFSGPTLHVHKSGDGTGLVTSVPEGINCGAVCDYSYNTVTQLTPATTVILTATASTDSTFTGWTVVAPDVCAGTGPCSVTMSTARNVTANFTKNSNTLTVNKVGSGTVTSGPVGIDCGISCTTSFPIATPVTLTAVADAGYTFTGWSAGTGSAAACAGTAPCNITMSAVSTVTATFTANNTLTINKVGLGTVTSSPAGITCGITCIASFANATPVTLTAVADAGYIFTGWSLGSGSAAACTGTGPCNITMSALSTLTATFSSSTGGTGYSVTVVKLGTGSGIVTSSPGGIACGTTCAASFNSGDTVTLTAAPDPSANVMLSGKLTYVPGSAFVGWGGDCTGTGTCVVTMAKAKNVTATFNVDSTGSNYPLSITKAGTGTGVVTSDPAGINCGTVCTKSFTGGTLVALTAKTIQGSGNIFVGWLGDCSGTGTCVVRMDRAQDVTATFDSTAISSKKTLYLYKLGSGSGSVTSDPSGIDCSAGCASTSADFDSGTLVTLTATHAQGSSFTGWSGGSSAVKVNSVAVDSVAKTVTLTLASAVTAGQSVTLAYTDPTSGNDGNAIQDIYGNDAVSVPVSSVTNLTGVTSDTTPPKFALATINGNTLVMSYVDAAHNLDAVNKPAVGAFTVKVGDSPPLTTTVNSVTVDSTAKKVTLTLATAVTMGQSVSVAYSDPTGGDDTNAIQDTLGNDAASLTETSVNNITGTSGDSIPPKFALATVNGDKLVMSYVGPSNLDAANLPAVSAFAVQVGGVNGCIGSAATCDVSMDTAKTVTATFDGVPPTFFTIHVSKMGAGKGRVYSSVASEDPIDCDSIDKDCDGSFSLGVAVVFKAVADSGSKFTAWTGCTNTPSSTEDCYVLKTAKDILTTGSSYGVTGTFTKTTASVRTLTVTKLGAGTGLISSTSNSTSSNQQNIDCGGACSVDFPIGATVTLTAFPGTPAFTGWKGACTGTLTTCTLSMESGKSVIATFIPSVTASLTGTGSGVVTSQPAGINCGGSCTAIFASGSSAILTATPKSGSLFAGWAGPCSGTATACTVGTSVTQNVTAMFSLANAAAAKPGAPVIASAKSGSGNAAIYFAAPASFGSSPLIRYDASCQASGLSPATASGTASPIVVRKLKPRTAYACSVTAVNSVGSSPSSAWLSVTPGTNANISSVLQLLLD
jgi:uncharacterized repeat protein (TIGR02059 family)